MSAPELDLRQREADRAEALAELEKLREEEPLPTVELPEDVDASEFEASILEASSGFETGRLHAEAREARSQHWQRNPIVGAKVGARITDLLEEADELLEGSPERDSRIRQAGALATWLKREAEAQMPLGRPVSRKGFHHPDGSWRVVDTFSSGRKVTVSRRSAEELAALQAKRDQRSTDDEAFGVPDKSGQITVTPEAVAEWPAEKWFRFRQDHPQEAEDLLQGRTVTGVRIREPESHAR